MNYTLKNEEMEVGFTTLGGTLSSIKDCNGLEYLWQGDKEYWSGQAPVCFPICGSVRDDKATVGTDKTTQMPRHGIVRKREFQFVSQDENSITFSIESNEDMKKEFPYDFKLYTKYSIQGKELKVTFEVENTGKEQFPFFIGGHPGFNCPLVAGEQYSDYSVIFEKEEDCDVPTPVTSTGLIDMEHRTPLFHKENTLKLDHSLFEVDAIILDKLKSREVKMLSNISGKGVSVSFKDFPYLILWSSANHGDFVALEPWGGLSTCSDEGDAMEDKRNVQFVEAGKTKKYSFTITIF